MPEVGDTQPVRPTAPTGEGPQEPHDKEYELVAVASADVEVASQVVVGDTLGLFAGEAAQVWAAQGVVQVGRLPAAALLENPGVVADPSAYVAPVSRTEAGQVPRIWVRIQIGG